MKTLIAVPCGDMVPVDFMTSMINLKKPEGTSYSVHANSMIYDSRNNLAAKALVNGYDRILWLDSDMEFGPDTLIQMHKDLDENGIDMVCGLYFKRIIPTGPCVYRELIYEIKPDGTLRADAVAVEQYPDGLFEVAGCGFGAVLMKTDILKEVWEKFGPPFDPMTQMGEDLSFCWRYAKLGGKMWCDPQIKVGHIGRYTYSEKDWKKQWEI